MLWEIYFFNLLGTAFSIVWVSNILSVLYIFYLGIRFRPILRCCWTMQVTCHILKLVLRNNALTTLRGIENLKSLEGLDVSYNIISNFSELEYLAGLPALQSLWLEGNPLCCARWYRSHVFSYLTNPEKVSYDLPYFSFWIIFLHSFGPEIHRCTSCLL